MPLKWKIYYACAFYMLLWALCCFIYVVYTLIKEPLRRSDLDFIIIMFVMLLLCIVKAGTCMVMLRHLARTTKPRKTGKVFFIVFFAVNILFVLLNTGFFYLMIDSRLNNDERSSMPSISVLEWSMIASFAAAACAGMFMAIFDITLLKTVNKNYQDTLLSFEANAN